MVLLKTLTFCLFVGIVSSKLVCDQEPMDLGIVLDSSKTVDYDGFDQSKDFLNTYLSQFKIGNGVDDLRVSIIPYAYGVYEQDAFNLTTHTNKKDVLAAINRIQFQKGDRTDTADAIEYVRKYQLNSRMVRPNIRKVCLVLTDGLSRRPSATEAEARAARNDGIQMFALGVGSVNYAELDRIAGSRSRVIKVKNYHKLSNALQDLTNLINKCRNITTTTTTTTTTTMRTTTPKPVKPADVNFVFSPSDLGMDSNSWTSSFISFAVEEQDIDDKGFHFGFITGQCPRDVPLNRFTNVEDVTKHVMDVYDKYRLLDLAKITKDNGFSFVNGGRTNAKKVAVLFANEKELKKGGEGGGILNKSVLALNATGIEVYMAYPKGHAMRVQGAISLYGKGSFEQALQLIQHLHHRDEYLR